MHCDETLSLPPFFYLCLAPSRLTFWSCSTCVFSYGYGYVYTALHEESSAGFGSADHTYIAVASRASVDRYLIMMGGHVSSGHSADICQCTQAVPFCYYFPLSRVGCYREVFQLRFTSTRMTGKGTRGESCPCSYLSPGRAPGVYHEELRRGVLSASSECPNSAARTVFRALVPVPQVILRTRAEQRHRLLTKVPQKNLTKK